MTEAQAAANARQLRVRKCQAADAAAARQRQPASPHSFYHPPSTTNTTDIARYACDTARVACYSAKRQGLVYFSPSDGWPTGAKTPHDHSYDDGDRAISARKSHQRPSSQSVKQSDWRRGSDIEAFGGRAASLRLVVVKGVVVVVGEEGPAAVCATSDGSKQTCCPNSCERNGDSATLQVVTFARLSHYAKPQPCRTTHSRIRAHRSRR